MKNLALLIVLLFLSGCYYDSNEALYGVPATGCNTDITRFNTEIRPILQSNCITCHANSVALSSGGGIKLQDYADVKSYVLNGKLVGSIDHSTGFSAMPKGGVKLSDCNILIIKTWISKGALND
jgi:cytochrome c5